MVACAVGLVALLAAARPRRISGASLALGAAVVVVVGAVVAVHEIREVRSAPSGQQSVSARLVSASTSYRADYWRVAADMVGRAPLRGEGAGSFTRVWLRERDRPIDVRDAHNLYLETAAVGGAVGLAILLVALGGALVRWRPAARHTAGRAALGAYLALLAHAAVDWDWELPAVTVAMVLLAVVVIRSGDTGLAVPLTALRRGALLAAAAGIGAVGVVAHAGNTALVEAHDALDRGVGKEAARHADRARRFAPWAAEPWRLLGEAEAALGRIVLAERHIRQAIDEDPDAWESWLALAFSTRDAERDRAVGEARRRNPLAPELEVFGSADP
jgi:O-antigen ligase